jgi:hypothetical protein
LDIDCVWGEHLVMAYLYDGYVQTLSRRFAAAIDEMQTNFNFDLGDEFEVAICKVMRSVLPSQYGICRGFVVDINGNCAGDDIIIFDRLRFPTLRALNADDYSLKERIPIEAVYAYIEAKHRLTLGEGGTLAKANAQVAAVKRLISTRASVPISQIRPYFDLGGGLRAAGAPGYPKQLNPPFAAVLSRHVELASERTVSSDPERIHTELSRYPWGSAFPPDLILAGEFNAVASVWVSEGQRMLNSPFFIPSQSELVPLVADNVAFGCFLSLLLSGIDWIQLGVMPWNMIASDGFGLRVT